MIKSLTVTNFLGESIKMVLNQPWDTGFLIESIDGLGPAKANINITEVSGADGGEYNSSRADTKNIVIKFRFVGTDIESIRQESYKYFPIKQQVKLTIETDNRTASIEGYTESNEPDIFSEDEGCQISILCPSSYFHSDDYVTVFTGYEQDFEFPFSNEWQEGDSYITPPHIILGEYKDDIYREIYYYGDVDNGIRVYIHCLGSPGSITILNATTRETMTIDNDIVYALLGESIKAGDDILLSTIKGDRFVTLYRDGVYYNILNAITQNSSWIKVHRGRNVFGYSADAITNLEFKILNDVLFEGV